MQRIAILLVVSLILAIGLGSTTAGKNVPDSFRNPSVGGGGDDHTWGGEQGWGDTNGGEDDPRSAFNPWGFIITNVLTEHLFFESTEALRITGFIFGGRDQSQSTSQVISSNKGN